MWRDRRVTGSCYRVKVRRAGFVWYPTIVADSHKDAEGRASVIFGDANVLGSRALHPCIDHEGEMYKVGKQLAQLDIARAWNG